MAKYKVNSSLFDANIIYVFIKSLQSINKENDITVNFIFVLLQLVMQKNIRMATSENIRV